MIRYLSDVRLCNYLSLTIVKFELYFQYMNITKIV